MKWNYLSACLGYFIFHQAFKPSHKEQHSCQQITPSVYSTDIYLQDINMVATLQPFQTSMQLPNPGERKSCTNNLNNTKCTQTEKEFGHPTAIPMTNCSQRTKCENLGGTPYPWQDGSEKKKKWTSFNYCVPFFKIGCTFGKRFVPSWTYPVLKLFIFTQTNTRWDGGAQGTDVYCKVVPTLYKSGSCAQLKCRWNYEKEGSE